LKPRHGLIVIVSVSRLGDVGESSEGADLSNILMPECPPYVCYGVAAQVISRGRRSILQFP